MRGEELGENLSSLNPQEFMINYI
ncbi:hypothetical protein COMA2_140099 [Candidatus Nitrospira nitrificans]|uniref:Uncharacterized protein n=1 Tax=Candidatus Nitrospira nitrificans TaxID=1742973 RepID=A0A0S4L8H2_9BACT|nr:hypothetical protein COMA2_140099 [Candidatus Nitrospira nitrificans]